MYEICITGALGTTNSTMPDDNNQLWNDLHTVKEIEIGKDTAIVQKRKINGNTMIIDCTITNEMEGASDKIKAWIGDIMTNVPVTITVKKA